MTPNVRNILIEARARIHAAIANTACLPDTHALMAIDELLTEDAARYTASDPCAEDMVCQIAGHDASQAVSTSAASRPPEVDPQAAEIARLKAELEREKRAREQDSKIIDGLRKRGES